MTILTQRAVAMLDLSRGGFMQLYDILDGDRRVGSKNVHAIDRGTKACVTYKLGAAVFGSAAEFIAAYQAHGEQQQKQQNAAPDLSS